MTFLGRTKIPTKNHLICHCSIRTFRALEKLHLETGACSPPGPKQQNCEPGFRQVPNLDRTSPENSNDIGKSTCFKRKYIFKYGGVFH